MPSRAFKPVSYSQFLSYTGIVVTANAMYMYHTVDAIRFIWYKDIMTVDTAHFKIIVQVPV